MDSKTLELLVQAIEFPSEKFEMGFLSAFGEIFIGLTIIGFLLALYEASVLSSALVGQDVYLKFMLVSLAF